MSARRCSGATATIPDCACARKERGRSPARGNSRDQPRIPLAHAPGESAPAREPADFGRAANNVVAFFLVQFVTPPAEQAGRQEAETFPSILQAAGKDVSLTDNHARGLGGIAAKIVCPPQALDQILRGCAYPGAGTSGLRSSREQRVRKASTSRCHFSVRAWLPAGVTTTTARKHFFRSGGCSSLGLCRRASRMA